MLGRATASADCGVAKAAYIEARHIDSIGFGTRLAEFDRAGTGRLIGTCVATFLVVGQVINLVASGTSPSTPVLAGGFLIIIGDVVITPWD